jgi:hypothetical protein
MNLKLRYQWIGYLGVGISLISGSGCSDAADPSACLDLPVSVGSGTTPEFSWSPACHIYSLTVSGPDAGWLVSGGNVLQDVISSPVRYGVVPGGAVEDSPAQPLHAGVTYGVRLDRRNRVGGGVTLVAERSFTP